MEILFDHLTSTEFEELCYDLLHDMGFLNLNWRKGTGFPSSPADQGRDIEGVRNVQDIDNEIYLENWFIECKHHKRGISSSELWPTFMSAASEEPHVLLIITSGFLSNSTKEHIHRMKSRSKFRIKYWEKKNLETLLFTRTSLLSKYKLIEISKQHTMNFRAAYSDLERLLCKIASLATTIGMHRELGTVEQLWNELRWHTPLGNNNNNEIVKRSIQQKTELDLDLPQSLKIEELKILTTQLVEVTQDVYNSIWSKDILPLLQARYPKYIKKELRSIRILHLCCAVHLEIIESEFHGYDGYYGQRLDSSKIIIKNLTAFCTEENPLFTLFFWGSPVDEHIKILLESPNLLVECGLFNQLSIE